MYIRFKVEPRSGSMLIYSLVFMGVRFWPTLGQTTTKWENLIFLRSIFSAVWCQTESILPKTDIILNLQNHYTNHPCGVLITSGFAASARPNSRFATVAI